MATNSAADLLAGPSQALALESAWDNVEAQRKDISACLASPGVGGGTATLSWSNLTVTVMDTSGKERQILKGVDGYIGKKGWLAGRAACRGCPRSVCAAGPSPPQLRRNPAPAAEPNHMLAIMGPSGCGKTTLLGG